MNPHFAFPDLTRFFAPRSVAFIGATEDLSKFGGRCVRALLDFGFEGAVWPVNPGRPAVFGHRCYPSVADLPAIPDHVGIVLPAKAVPATLEQCAARGVPFVTVFSAGFGETATAEGHALQTHVAAIARASGMRVMGPNCNGLVNFVDRFAFTSTATIRGPRRSAGDVAVASHSGGAGQVNVMWRAQEAGLGISYQVSCGNDADLDLLDYAHFMLESAATRVVLLVAERISSGDKLRALAMRAHALDKPVVMVKVGRSAAGRRAALSHTGALTGEDAVTDAALRDFGIVRVDDCNELYKVGMLLRQRPSAGWCGQRRVAATSISGGNLVMLADLGEPLGLAWPDYTESTRTRLAEVLPGFSSAANPTDLTAAAIGQGNAFVTANEVILADANVEMLIPVVTMAPTQEITAIAELARSADKPVPILWTGGATDDPAFGPRDLVASGLAVYRDALPCLRALAASARYGEARQRLGMPAPVLPPDCDVDRARTLIEAAAGAMPEWRALGVLAACGIPVVAGELARTVDEAVRIAASTGGPVALKAQSAVIPHKTEAGAVRLGVAGDDAVRAAFREVMASAARHAPEGTIDGVLVQAMAPAGVDVMIGCARDAVFGPVITLALGGIHVEVLRDVVHVMPPVRHARALELIGALRGFALLQGVRGAHACDIDALADAIVRLSWLALCAGGALGELDINPLRVLPQDRGVLAIDALIVRPGA